MAVPEDILHKRGPLDPLERSFMRQHVTVGERMLRATPSLARLAPLVRSSHERWDGTGYPDGLAGEAIPLIARVVNAADTYDACTSRRPYQRTMGSEEAIEVVMALSGTQIDPRVADALVRVIRRSAAEMRAEPRPLSAVR